MTVLCIDIPDGTELDIRYSDGSYSGSVRVPVSDGIARFTLYGNELDKIRDSDELTFTIDYTVDGQDGSDTAKRPVDDGSGNKDRNDNNSGMIIDNGGGNNNQGGKNGGDDNNGGIKHGILIVGGGNQAGVTVDENRLFHQVDAVLGRNDGDPEIQLWYKGESISIPLDFSFIHDLFQ